MTELSREERQKALDDISPEDLDKIKGDNGGVDEHWMALGAIAEFYGAEMYFAAKEDRMTSEEVDMLLKVRDKLEARNLYNLSQAAFIASVSSSSKKPGNTFKKLTKTLVKRMRFIVDDYNR